MTAANRSAVFNSSPQSVRTVKCQEDPGPWRSVHHFDSAFVNNMLLYMGPCESCAADLAKSMSDLCFSIPASTALLYMQENWVVVLSVN